VNENKVAVDLETVNKISGVVVDAAIEVHRHLGPGLLESMYSDCLVRELALRGLRTETQVIVPLFYKGARIDHTFRLDLLVGGCVVVEVKA
jgi:GxxExxY protein